MDATGTAINRIDWSSAALVLKEVEDLAGNKYVVGIGPNDAFVNSLKDAKVVLMNKIRGPTKDGIEGNIINDAEGNELVSVQLDPDNGATTIAVSKASSRLTKYANLSTLPEATRLKLEAPEWTDELLAQLDQDLTDQALKLKIAEKGELVEAWRVLSADKAIRKNAADLAKVSDYIKKNSLKLDEVSDEFSRAINKRIWIDELGNSNTNLPSLNKQLLSKPSYLPNRTVFNNPYVTTTITGKWDELIDGNQRGLKKYLKNYPIMGLLIEIFMIYQLMKI